MAAVGRVLDFFFFLLLFPVSSPPLFAALAARAVALGGIGADGSNGGGDRANGGGDRSIDRSNGCNGGLIAAAMEDRSGNVVCCDQRMHERLVGKW